MEDQYLSAIIIAAMTGIFSIITIVIQKKQNKMIDKIDSQTIFLQKEYELKKLVQTKESEKDEIFKEIILKILKNSVHILESMNYGTEDLIETCNELSTQFITISKDIKDLQKEYSLLNSLNEQSKRDNN
jgi:hypothetical protein